MPSDKTIHIISFDVPFPADYGGVIDVFQRLAYWKSIGYDIILHCYEYGRGTSKELENYCKEVHYYKRKKRVLDLFSKVPFIVKTRINKSLVKRLHQDNFPIWIEGIHCSWLLQEPSLSNRKMLVRTHNIEHNYYNGLAKYSGFLKKIYYLLEAKKLEQYESILSKATALYAIQKLDFQHYQKINDNTFYLPSLPQNYFEFDDLFYSETKNYLLYQGSLNVEENQDAVVWLIENVFKYYPNRCKIAGKSIPKKIKNLCKRFKIDCIENPSFETMQKLMKEAKIHIMYTKQSTGLKLKLMNILGYNGEILVNDLMLEGSDWRNYCHIANSSDEFRNKIDEILGETSTKLVHLRQEAFKKIIFETQEQLSEIFEN